MSTVINDNRRVVMQVHIPILTNTEEFALIQEDGHLWVEFRAMNNATLSVTEERIYALTHSGYFNSAISEFTKAIAYYLATGTINMERR